MISALAEMGLKPRKGIEMSGNNSDPAAIIRAFYDEWDDVGFRQSYKNHMSDDVVVESPGKVHNGLQAWLAADDGYNATYDRPYGKVDLKTIAVTGNQVLTEREEICYNKETGDSFSGFKAMSTFDINADGKITRWAEYYDPSPYLPGGSALPKQKQQA